MRGRGGRGQGGTRQPNGLHCRLSELNLLLSLRRACQAGFQTHNVVDFRAALQMQDRVIVQRLASVKRC